MKKILFTLTIALSIVCADAQSTRLVIDKESLFTTTEIAHIDSILQAYHNKTGNLMALYTDSADISDLGSGDKAEAIFAHSYADSALSFILMLSRKHSRGVTSINKRTAALVKTQVLGDVLNSGLPLLKEKKREEAVLQIFNNAMKYLDSLPENIPSTH